MDVTLLSSPDRQHLKYISKSLYTLVMDSFRVTGGFGFHNLSWYDAEWVSIPNGDGNGMGDLDGRTSYNITHQKETSIYRQVIEKMSYC